VQGESPDIVAMRQGKQVNIELEFDSARVLRHYRVLYKSEQEEFENANRGKWVKQENTWHYLEKQTGVSLLSKEDKGYWFEETRCHLLYKTLKAIGIDIIIYWLRNDKFKFWEFDKEVELIDLREQLKL
jgi:hypothetical protein